MTLLATAFGWAETYTHTFEAGDLKKEGGQATLSGVVWTSSAVDYVGFESTNSARGFQIGSKNNPASTFTLSSSGFDGTISNVTVHASAYSTSAAIDISVNGTSYGSSSLATADAAYSYSGTSKGAITIKLTNATDGRAMYIKSISVTYETGNIPNAPTILLNGEAPKTQYLTTELPLTLTVTSNNGVATPDFCYSFSGPDWHTGFTTSAKTLDLGDNEMSDLKLGSNTLYVQELVNNVNSAWATATFVVKEPAQTLTSLADVNALEDNSEFTFGANTVVLGKKNQNLYIANTDNAAGIMVYNASGNWGDSFVFGAVIDSNWSGKKTTYRGQPEVTNATLTLTGNNTTPPLFEATIDDVKNIANYSRYAVLRGVTYNGSELSKDGNTVAVYDQIGGSIPTDFDGKTYDVIGVIGKYNDNYQFWPISFNEVIVDWQAPVITVTPNKEEYLVGDQITISIANPNDDEDAQIYYTLDGTEPTINSEVFGQDLQVTLSEAGTYTIKAFVLSTDETQQSATVTKSLTVADGPLTKLAEVNALANNDVFIFSAPLTVTANQLSGNNRYVYVIDADGIGGLFYNVADLADVTPGTTLSGTWEGTFKIYNSLPEITCAEGIEIGEAGEITYDDLAVEDVNSDVLNNVVWLRGVTISDINGSDFKINGTLAGRNTFSKEFEAGRYDILGAVGIFRENIQFQPIQLNKVSEPRVAIVGNCEELGNWVPEDAITLTASGENTYSITQTLPSGVKFKFLYYENGSGNEQWLGGQDDNYVGYFGITENLLGSPINLVDGADFQIDVPGTWTFTVNTAANPMTVTVTGLWPATPLYVVGSTEALGGWATDQAKEMTINEDHSYTYLLTTEEDNVEFKVLTSQEDGWNKPYYGPNGNLTLELNEAANMVQGGSGNFIIAEAGTYSININAAKTELVLKKEKAPVVVVEGCGVYERITSSDALEAGHRYLIVDEEASVAAGAVENAGKYLVAANVTILNNRIDATDTQATVFVLEGEDLSWLLKSEYGYLFSGANKNMHFEEEGSALDINFDETSGAAAIDFSTPGIILYNALNPRFTTYTSTPNANMRILYKELMEVPVIETTPMATILTEGEEDSEYTVGEALAVVKVKENNVYVTNGTNYMYLLVGDDIVGKFQEGKKLPAGSVTGTLADRDTYPALVVENFGSTTVNNEDIDADIQVIDMTTNLVAQVQPSQVVTVTGYWDGNALRAYSEAPQGQSIIVDAPESWTVGSAYTTTMAIYLNEPWEADAPSGAPARAKADDDLAFQNLRGELISFEIPTAVTELNTSADVKNVQYVNVAGQVSDRPFNGVNIVVTHYNNGTVKTTKLVK